MDLEMTGLDPDRDQILEMATIVTDGNLKILAEGPVFAIHQPTRVLNNMNAWCKKQHKKSGLVDRVKQSDITLEKAEKETLKFIKKWVGKNKSPLCGNSIHQDRAFLRHYMPTLNDYLHYRLIDVSTIKELAKRWYKTKAFEKESTHLALDDIRDSIEELNHYRELIFVP
jgi:oligoribonuclease